MSKIKQVVIPIAGFGSRMFPVTLELTKAMLPIVNRPVIEYLIEESVKAGANEIIIVMSLNQVDVKEYLDLNNAKAMKKFENNVDIIELKELLDNVKITYVIQTEQKGLGHAIAMAKEYITEDYFGVILGDNPILGSDDNYGIIQLANEFKKQAGYYIGVNEVTLEDTKKYGVVKADNYEGTSFLMNGMIEKPKSNPPSHYAALGRYILGKKIFDYLENTEAGALGEIQVTDAIRVAIEKEKVYATKLSGTCHDTGNRLGFVIANIEYALKREDIKEDVKAYIKELAKTL